jgi:hypothetical protein
VLVVECRYQFDLLGLKHAVAKHIATHVSDTHASERRSLNVLAQLTEVPLYGFPCAARGDTHRLVIVAG